MKFSVMLGKKLLKTGILAILLIPLLWFNPTASAKSILPGGNAITDGQALLRYALPIDNKPIRQIQSNIEDISNHLRGKRWNPISKDVNDAAKLLNTKQSDILASIIPARQPAAQTLIADLQKTVESLKNAVNAKNKEQTWIYRAESLKLIGQIEQAMISQFPFEVPAEYSNLPQLQGRATIEMETTKGKITLIVDGYSAPVTAGNFVDLVERGFYTNLPFTRAEESYVLQVGDPPGPEQGFIDPATGKYRAIPLEILVKGDKEPTYGITLEDAGRYLDQPVLPFSAYGAVAMARPESEPNGGSSQFFFFLFEPELTPAGLNLLDGRYAIFGYVIDGKDVLGKLKAGDMIESAKVIQGSENLKQPQTA